MIKISAIFISMLLLTSTGCNQGNKEGKVKKEIEKITVKSPAFQSGGKIPSKFTCDGENISPALQWGPVPEGTVTFALIADDPDAPSGTWVHWVIYNIPPGVTNLPEKTTLPFEKETGAISGKSSFGKGGYGGPCPPGGTHRYFFKIYALDTNLTLPALSSKQDLLKAMEGHIIGQGELMGTYQRN
jgi:Raf kinase inhibitor-like YbhB/YbcL family protein